MPAPVVLFAANLVTKGKASDPVFWLKAVSIVASVSLVGSIMAVGGIMSMFSNQGAGGVAASIAEECENQLGVNSEFTSLDSTTNIPTDLIKNASQEQLAKIIIKTSLNNGWGYNGALMALYVGLAETNLTNTTDAGRGEPNTTSRGIYRQMEGYAWKNAWSGNWRRAPINLTWEEYEGQKNQNDAHPGSKFRAKYFNKSNAWGQGGWAESDIRMNPAKATEKFLENLKKALENDFDLTKKEFTDLRLSDDQMYAYAKATQRFSKDGQYRTIQGKARQLLSRMTIDENSLSAGSDAINIYSNTVFTNKSGGVINPVRNSRISATFGQAGSRWSSGYHTGTDYAAPKGTPIYSVTGGRVVFAASTRGPYTGGYGAYGKMVKILGESPSGDRVETWYAHLDNIFVKKDQRITVGQQIGTVGSTGNSTGPHLHLEMRINNRIVNPGETLAAWGASDMAGTGMSTSSAYLLGDSMTNGSKSHFGRYAQGYEFEYDAKNGLFTKDAIYILDDKLKEAEEDAARRKAKGLEPLPYTITLRNEKAKAADTWIVGLGTNDAWSGLDKSVFKEHAEKILDLARGKNVIWVNVYIDRGRKLAVKDINEGLDELAAQYRNVRVLDYNTAVQDNLPYLASDGIHLTPEGYRWRAELYSKAIGNLETSYGVLNVEGVDCNEVVLGTQSGDASKLLLSPEQFGGSAPPNTQAAIAIQYALREHKAGKPYRNPARPPISYDCSLLTAHAWREAGVKIAPFSNASNGKYVSLRQYNETTRIPLQQMQPGDLLFYFEHGAHHVSMYIGNGKMVHAANQGRGIAIDDISNSWYVKRFTGVGRVKTSGTQVDTYWASNKSPKPNNPSTPNTPSNQTPKPNTSPKPNPTLGPKVPPPVIPPSLDIRDLLPPPRLKAYGL
jgi:murein DD-endopeptidase MepM/ murein hydrolase activator NlpD